MTTREEIYNIFNSYRDYIKTKQIGYQVHGFPLTSGDILMIKCISYSRYSIIFAFRKKDVDILINFLGELLLKRDNISTLVILGRSGITEKYFFVNLTMDVDNERTNE